MADVDNFFTRWSRRKQQARKPRALASEAGAKDAPVLVETAPTELPPLESLTAESDYTAFLRPDVADATRNAALQKLWRSDPVFANLDGLVEYGEDYAALFNVSAAVRTAYRVAQGMSGNTPPPKETDQSLQQAEKNLPAGAASQPESGTESSSDRSAKDRTDMHESRIQGWTGA